MIEFILTNKALLLKLTFASIILFIGTLIALPIIIAKIPSNYFLRKDAPRNKHAMSKKILYFILLILRNIIGLIFIIMGIIMIFTPGQGLLAIFIGIMLTSFPYKRQLERKLISKNNVFKALNWIRKKQKVDPLLKPKL